jgi:hypothetical protein
VATPEEEEKAMSIRLPAAIDLYFSSENAYDASAIDRCFVGDAIVRDEGKIIKGVAAIKTWRLETGGKYHHAVEPIALSTRGGKVVVASRVSGDFPGSPINLDHIFEIEGDRIVSLEIRP